jgi:hypothetical protein
MCTEMAGDEPAVEVVRTAGLEACHDGQGLAAEFSSVLRLGARLAAERQHDSDGQRTCDPGPPSPATSRVHWCPRPRCGAPRTAERLRRTLNDNA